MRDKPVLLLIGLDVSNCTMVKSACKARLALSVPEPLNICNFKEIILETQNRIAANVF